MPNRLAKETSPYLVAHSNNPVDWYAWGDEAFARAKAEDRPLLLSIGYSACHWCHVMERESFEDARIAAIMNEHFVSVKVDREERPDIDQIYQLGIQLLTRHGGWPLTVFCFPDGRPFYGGTYFPPTDRHGMPGLPTLLQAIAAQWRMRRADFEGNAKALVAAVKEVSTVRVSVGEPTVEGIRGATKKLAARVDTRHGGFGSKPKFPNSTAVSLLLREYAHGADAEAKELAEITLRGMMGGGMYDQIGGGFHRYSVDERWLVPHFEKMLYDNALLSNLYLEGWRTTGDDAYGAVVRETLDWAIREMQSPDGGYWSTQDADSEGDEGKFFVWRPREIEEVLGKDDADVAMRVWGVTEMGNFEHGATVLSVNRAPDLVARAKGIEVSEVLTIVARAKARLFEVREKRVKPFRDEKVLACWNGLLIGAMAQAGATLGEPKYVQSAIGAARFLEERMTPGGRLQRCFKDGVVKIDGYLEDLSFVASGLLDLYEATLDERWIVRARALLDDALARFRDADTGLFFFTSVDHEALFHRAQDPFDNATPSGSSVAADALLRLADLTGDESLRAAAEPLVRSYFEAACDNPFGFSYLLGAADRLVRGSTVIALAADDLTDVRLQALHAAAMRTNVPNRVVLLVKANDPLGRKPVDGAPAAYVCRGRTCSPPVTDPARLAESVRT